jgi:hypothetical protein
MIIMSKTTLLVLFLVLCVIASVSESRLHCVEEPYGGMGKSYMQAGMGSEGEATIYSDRHCRDFLKVMPGKRLDSSLNPSSDNFIKTNLEPGVSCCGTIKGSEQCRICCPIGKMAYCDNRVVVTCVCK